MITVTQKVQKVHVERAVVFFVFFCAQRGQQLRGLQTLQRLACASCKWMVVVRTLHFECGCMCFTDLFSHERDFIVFFFASCRSRSLLVSPSSSSGAVVWASCMPWSSPVASMSTIKKCDRCEESPASYECRTCGDDEGKLPAVSFKFCLRQLAVVNHQYVVLDCCLPRAERS